MNEENMNLGALERPKDERDFPLGATIVPQPRAPRLNADMSWFKRNYQAQLPFCGPHSKSHNKAIQDHGFAPSVAQRFTPRFSAIRMKDPISPSYDGYPVDAGTDMRALFKMAKTEGEDVFDPLENDTTLSIGDYANSNAVTPDMKTAAAQSLINGYAFDQTPGGPTYDSIADATCQWKSVVLLIRCDSGFWGTLTPTFTEPKYGHFVTAYDYDDEKGGIYVVDSAEPDEQFALKFIDKKYIVQPFFVEAGTTVDLPPSVHQALSQGQIDVAKQILANMSKILELDLEWLKTKVHGSA